MEQGEYQDAEADFTRAMEFGGPKLQALQLRSHVREKLNDVGGADADRKTAAGLKPVRDCDFITRGYTRMKSDPREALEDFRKALELNPASLVARCNRIHVLADVLEDKAEAVKASAELVRVFPLYTQGHAIHALCLARLGKRDEAIAEVEACRRLLQEKGPSHRDPAVIFVLARVYAVTSATRESDAEQAVRTLKEALGSGYRDFRWIERNRDLDSIRSRADFERAVKAAKDLAN
jgi:tetratricopeptide (TPR) repeat protein